MLCLKKGEIMARKIVITSGKGGVGKTTITANLGMMIASKNKRVVVFDMDIGLNNLDIVLGVENKVVYDIIDVIEGRCRPKQALIQHSKQPTLFVMPSSHLTNLDRITAKHIKSVIDALDEFFDFILIDCPAGIDIGFHRAVYASDEAIIITTPHLSSIRDADKVITLLSSYNLSNIRVLVNRVRGDMVISGDMIDVNQISNLLRVKLIGAIPEDDDISTLSVAGETITFKSDSYKSFNLLTENLINGTNFIYDCTYKYSGFWGNIRRSLKRRV